MMCIWDTIGHGEAKLWLRLGLSQVRLVGPRGDSFPLMGKIPPCGFLHSASPPPKISARP